MSFQQTIPAEAIKAAALFAARDRGRYSFNGLCLEHGRLIATDGRRIAVIEWTPDEKDSPPDAVDSNGQPSIILPVDVSLAAAKVKGCEAVTVNGTMVPKLGRAVAPRSLPPAFPYEPVEGTFPDWRAVMLKANRERKAEPVRLNPGFLADVGKAVEILHGKHDAQTVNLEITSKAEAVEFTASVESLTFRALVMPVTS